MVTAVLRPEVSREQTVKYIAADIKRNAPDGEIYVTSENEELSYYLGTAAPVIDPRRLGGSPERPGFLFAYQQDVRNLTPSLRDRTNLLEQWDRPGSAGPPALYRIEPDDLKAAAARAK